MESKQQLTKEKILSESQYESIINDMLFCPKCMKIPLISIITTNPPKVKIFCQCETKIMSLIFYLKEISNNNKALPKQQS